eukprot:m51a1_g3662 hypothetical protein (535) ;mRNA; f:239152-246345
MATTIATPVCEQCRRALPEYFVYVGRGGRRQERGPGDPEPRTEQVRLREIADADPARVLGVPHLCNACADRVVHRIKAHMREEEAYRQAYTTAIDDLQRIAPAVTADIPVLRSRLSSLEEEERELQKAFAQAEAERASAREEEEEIAGEEQALCDAEERHWSELNRFFAHARQSEDEASAYDAEAAFCRAQSRVMARVDVYREVFVIALSPQSIAMINACRLGRLPAARVEWDEINAAWGHAALLLYVLSKKLRVGSASQRYRVQPFAGRSKIQIVPQQQPSSSQSAVELPLYGSDEVRFAKAAPGAGLWPFGSGGGSQHGGAQAAAAPGSQLAFDDAIEAFMSCLWDLVLRCRELCPGVAIPCVIDRDRIRYKDKEYVTVRTLSSTEESWTKAMQYDDLAYHCNAHPNNLAVLPPALARGGDQLLAPLDLDMAFGEAEYTGSRPFGEVLATERGTMALSLAGDDQLNTGAAAAAAPLPEPLSSLRWALRDTAVRALCAAVEGGWSPCGCSPEDDARCRALVGLALIVTADHVA